MVKGRKQRSNRKSRRMNGGMTQGYSFGGVVSPAALGYPEVMRQGCGGADAFGRLGGQNMGSQGGLPMKGGRYEFAGDVTDAGIWSSGGRSIPCERSHHNPLNLGGATPTTTPLMRQSGGNAPFPYALQETTAGYTQLARGGPIPTSAGGTPLMLNIPSGGRMGISPSCVTTGGRRRKGRKSRKSRCKGRKATRKH